MLQKKYMAALLTGAALTATIGAGALTFAATTPTSGAAASQERSQPGVGGTVTAVSGNTITLTGMDGKTYTIEAGSAAITKDMTVSVSDIKVGDTVMAQGTVNGTSVSATSIHAGKLPMGGFGKGHGPMGMGVHGKVTAVSGSTLTIEDTNPRDNTTKTFTVDASKADITSIAVGDEVMVMGTVSGTTVTATKVVEGGFPHMMGAKPTQAQ